MHQLGPRYLCLLRAESQGVDLQLIDHSSMLGVIHHRFSQGKVARGIAETWDALIICSCISLVHGTFAAGRMHLQLIHHSRISGGLHLHHLLISLVHHRGLICSMIGVIHHRFSTE